MFRVLLSTEFHFWVQNLLDPKQTALCLKIYKQQGVLTTLALSHIYTYQLFLSQMREIFSLS